MNLKSSLIIIIMVLYVFNANAIEMSAWTTANSKGTDYTAADGSFRTTVRPDQCTEFDGAPRFNVLVNHEAYVGLYCAQNEWGGTGNFGQFEFRNGEEMEIVVSCRKELGDYDILPHNADIYDVEQVSSKILRFKTKTANQNLTIVLNAEYQTGDVLHLFCNDIDEEEPTVDAEKKAQGGYFYDRGTKTYYFGPGYYDLGTMMGGSVTASGGRNIYIAAGAVLNGQVCISGQGSRIYGHGMVVQSKPGSSSELNCSNCTDGSVNGVIFYRYKVEGWQTTYTYCSNMQIKNIKVICVYGPCSDGMDFQGCHDMQFENCFVRANDDAVAIKGLSDEKADPALAPAEEHLYFNRMQLWSSANGGFNIGAETRSKVFNDIKLTNSEILYSFDGKGLNGSMDDRSALNICCLWGTYFTDILYENVVVNRCERLIGATFKDSFWYGTIQGNQTWPGEMQRITYRNVTSAHNTEGKISNDILFLGWHQSEPMAKYPDGTPDKFIHDITFENVVVEGEPVLGWDNPHLKTNNSSDLQLVYDLHFIQTDGIADIVGDKKHSTYSDKSDYIFTLSGQRMRKPTKGIFIVNGKKYINN